ncbi:hypothetical protein [Pseudorhizobium pelagicum]|uniref:Uncharacterized protein n=1 Tax=Pseudorhizobium pelagicum TaxID=1509405 RepID=A0A922P4K5_9HYPH|nr:hypothetical protein [Pseudorhizobium pelagicum]KEQ09328.1 hypothetical protein GV67_01230 [Pseudorhizobium pelagicum]KEQ10851.1 hypothetical protein GV68_00815 [Pseudorhizobium pelagicum]
MALSNAERQRLHYQRQKDKKKGDLKQPDSVDLGVPAEDPFYEWFQGQAGGFSDFAKSFDIAGIEAPDIDDDSNPKSLSGEIERSFEDEPERSPYARGGGSLARGEIMVGCLIDAASELARIINEYKRNQITSRLREIENADLSDPGVKKAALTEVVRLQKMVDHLDKRVRWSFPQWKLADE